MCRSFLSGGFEASLVNNGTPAKTPEGRRAHHERQKIIDNMYRKSLAPWDDPKKG
jgi:hypothetical protein